MELFTTTLDLYGGVLWSGELQGFIIHERIPNNNKTQNPKRKTRGVGAGGGGGGGKGR
jgi:hypothetical protein